MRHEMESSLNISLYETSFVFLNPWALTADMEEGLDGLDQGLDGPIQVGWTSQEENLNKPLKAWFSSKLSTLPGSGFSGFGRWGGSEALHMRFWDLGPYRAFLGL